MKKTFEKARILGRTKLLAALGLLLASVMFGGCINPGEEPPGVQEPELHVRQVLVDMNRGSCVESDYGDRASIDVYVTIQMTNEGHGDAEGAEVVAALYHEFAVPPERVDRESRFLGTIQGDASIQEELHLSGTVDRFEGCSDEFFVRAKLSADNDLAFHKDSDPFTGSELK